MARPTKHGLDYFPFDVDFFSDEKLYAISGEFGIKGEITTIKLLCAVYRNGYYIEWTEMLKYKLLKELPSISADLLEQILKRLVKWDFFDKSLFDSASILTSKGIQRRYLTICAKMHRKNAISEYCLLEQPAPTAERPKSAPVRPRVATAPAAPAPAPPPTQPQAAIPLEQSIPQLLKDTIWSESVCMRYQLKPEEFPKLVEDFRRHCLCFDRKTHKDLTDAQRHFCSWLRKTYKADSKKSVSKQTPAKPDYTFCGGFGGVDV